MADPNLWRKNLPPGFDGRHGEHWDDEIEMKPIIWTTVAVALAVVVAFIFNWWLMHVFEGFQPEPELSPIAEFNERRLPPQPWLQPSPEMELDEMREHFSEHLSGYGWSDQLEGMVHIPVDEAIELVVASKGSVAGGVEPNADQPIDVEASGADAAETEDAEAETDETGAAEGEAVH